MTSHAKITPVISYKTIPVCITHMDFIL